MRGDVTEHNSSNLSPTYRSLLFPPNGTRTSVSNSSQTVWPRPFLTFGTDKTRLLMGWASSKTCSSSMRWTPEGKATALCNQPFSAQKNRSGDNSVTVSTFLLKRLHSLVEKHNLKVAWFELDGHLNAFKYTKVLFSSSLARRIQFPNQPHKWHLGCPHPPQLSASEHQS